MKVWMHKETADLIVIWAIGYLVIDGKSWPSGFDEEPDFSGNLKYFNLDAYCELGEL